jgi:hypothetical protein
MVEFIAHRVNTLDALKLVPEQLGTEIDLRDRGNRLILQHDPFSDGEDAEPFFESYRHGTLILNIKSERIEWRVLELMQKYKIENYFFLDSSLPMVYALTNKAEHRVAVRFSEIEGLDTIMNLKGKVQWVWVDCFTYLPLTPSVFAQLKQAGFKLCLVSPELQGRPEEVAAYAARLVEQNTIPDAICTKQYLIEKWQTALVSPTGSALQ